jgi:type IV pilus assembly protein PilY1
MQTALLNWSTVTRKLRWTLLAASVGVTLVISAATTATQPLVDLAAEPIYMNGGKTKANLTLALSVELPTVGQTYRGTNPKKAEYNPRQL